MKNQKITPLIEIDSKGELSERFHLKQHMDNASVSSPKQSFCQIGKDPLQQEENLFAINQKSTIFQQPSASKFDSIVKHLKIKKLVHKIIQQIPSRMYKSLQPRHFQLINDQTQLFFLDQFKKPSSHQNQPLPIAQKFYITDDSQNMQSILSKLLQRPCFLFMKKKIRILVHYLELCIPIINPSNQYKLVWDLLQVAIEMLMIFFIPIYLIFNLTFNSLIGADLCIIIPILLFIDLLLNLITGYFEKGQLIKERIKIILHWSKNMMIFDCLSTLPLIMILLSESKEENKEKLNPPLNYSLLLFFFKLKNIMKTFNKYEEAYAMKSKSIFFINFGKLFGFVIIMGHFFACIWLYLGYSELKEGLDNWIQTKHLQEDNWNILYLYSYYYACVTMQFNYHKNLLLTTFYYHRITIGYGDITPTSPKETLVCIFLMFFACGVFGYNLNTIQYIFQHQFRNEEKKKNNLISINNYMQKKNISKDLQGQIREYLDYIWKENNDDVQMEDNVINQLSDLLKDKLLVESNKLVLKDSPIFCKNFSDTIISKTVALIKEYKCTPGEIIFLEGDRDDSSIYFIEKGSVEIFINQNSINGLLDNQAILYLLQQGNAFGEINFFTGNQRNYNARSCEFTTLLQIKRQDFLDLLSMYQEDYEKFCHIRDNIVYYQNFERIDLKCNSCQSKFHTINECPYIHSVPNKLLMISKFNYSKQQERNLQHIRKKKKKTYKTLKNAYQQILDIEKFQFKYSEDLDVYELNQGLYNEDNDEESQEEEITNLMNQIDNNYNISLNSAEQSTQCTSKQPSVQVKQNNSDQPLLYDIQEDDDQKSEISSDNSSSDSQSMQSMENNLGQQQKNQNQYSNQGIINSRSDQQLSIISDDRFLINKNKEQIKPNLDEELDCFKSDIQRQIDSNDVQISLLDFEGVKPPQQIIIAKQSQYDEKEFESTSLQNIQLHNQQTNNQESMPLTRNRVSSINDRSNKAGYNVKFELKQQQKNNEKSNHYHPPRIANTIHNDNTLSTQRILQRAKSIQSGQPSKSQFLQQEQLNSHFLDANKSIHQQTNENNQNTNYLQRIKINSIIQNSIKRHNSLFNNIQINNENCSLQAGQQSIEQQQQQIQLGQNNQGYLLSPSQNAQICQNKNVGRRKSSVIQQLLNRKLSTVNEMNLQEQFFKHSVLSDPYFGFDIGKNYQFYFPHNNYQIVLNNIAMKEKLKQNYLRFQRMKKKSIKITNISPSVSRLAQISNQKRLSHIGFMPNFNKINISAHSSLKDFNLQEINTKQLNLQSEEIDQNRQRIQSQINQNNNDESYQL